MGHKWSHKSISSNLLEKMGIALLDWRKIDLPATWDCLCLLVCLPYVPLRCADPDPKPGPVSSMLAPASRRGQPPPLAPHRPPGAAALALPPQDCGSTCQSDLVQAAGSPYAPPLVFQGLKVGVVGDSQAARLRLGADQMNVGRVVSCGSKLWQDKLLG